MRRGVAPKYVKCSLPTLPSPFPRLISNCRWRLSPVTSRTCLTQSSHLFRGNIFVVRKSKSSCAAKYDQSCVSVSQGTNWRGENDWMLCIYYCAIIKSTDQIIIQKNSGFHLMMVGAVTLFSAVQVYFIHDGHLKRLKSSQDRKQLTKTHNRILIARVDKETQFNDKCP